MQKNNWEKGIGKEIPYLTYESISKNIRSLWDANRHSNITYELHVILEGSCQLEIENTTFTLETGQAVIIRPGAFHSALSTSTPFSRFTLAFFFKNPTPFSDKFSENDLFIFFDTTAAAQQLCQEILQEVDNPNPCLGEEMISVLLSQLWILIFRSILPQNLEAPSTAVTSFSDIRTIELFFSSVSKKKCTRKNLAELLHCSERQVNRILLQLYGMNFRQKKQQTRMDHAKFLLRNTDKTISEICVQIGYSDETTFYKSFKAAFQMTPQEFRRSCSRTKE